MSLATADKTDIDLWVSVFHDLEPSPLQIALTRESLRLSGYLSCSRDSKI